MDEQQAAWMRQVEREKALYCYSLALEKSDFDAIASVLRLAEEDQILEQMLLELDEVYTAELEMAMHAEAAELVHRLLMEHFSKEFTSEEEEVDIPRLTVGNVIAHLDSDNAIRGSIRQEMANVTQHLQQSNIVLPETLNQRSVQHLFEQIGVSVSKRFQKIFRAKAIFLSMGRAQGMAHLAVTRKQRHQRKQRPLEEENRNE
jgi:hypothetical protein